MLSALPSPTVPRHHTANLDSVACAPLHMPHRLAAPHRACWTDLADVNLGNTVWPPGDARCAYRHATLRRAQLACESAVLTP